MSSDPPSRALPFSRWMLAVSLIIAGIGLGALVREIAVDRDAAIEARADELFADQVLTKHTELLNERDPRTEANTAMAKNDFRLLERAAPAGIVVDGVTCDTAPASKQVYAFEDTVEPHEKRSTEEVAFYRALKDYVSLYNATIVRNPVFADLWGCTIDSP